MSNVKAVQDASLVVPPRGAPQLATCADLALLRQQVLQCVRHVLQANSLLVRAAIAQSAQQENTQGFQMRCAKIAPFLHIPLLNLLFAFLARLGAWLKEGIPIAYCAVRV